MESKTGSILALISSIIFFVISAAVLIIGVLVVIFGEATTEGVNIELSKTLMGIIVFVIFIITLAIALLYLKASHMMKIPNRCHSGAILCLVLGILTIGSVAGILGVIGGAIGLGDSKKRAIQGPVQKQPQVL